MCCMDSSAIDIYLFYFSSKVENKNFENDATIESNVVRIWQRKKCLIFNGCHPFLLMKVCHMLSKGGLMLVIYGDRKWGEGQTRLAIFMIATFLFQDLLRDLLAIQGDSKASLLFSGTLNQIFPTWKLKNSLLYLAGRFPQLSELVQKVSPKEFVFIPVLLFCHYFCHVILF